MQHKTIYQMDWIPIILGYPIGLISNLSTDYLNEKFGSNSFDSLKKLFTKSFISELNKLSYIHIGTEKEVIKCLINEITKSPEKLFAALNKLNYSSLSIKELKSEKFITDISQSIQKEYDLEKRYPVTKKFQKIIENCFKNYERNFIGSLVKNPSDQILFNSLEKLQSTIATKKDIEKLRQLLSDNFISVESYDRENAVISQDVLNLINEELSNPELETFSNPIMFRMRQLDKNVEKLTKDQFQLITFMRYENQALISGCAGSGKTLIAAEKAIRLSKQGYNILILCHNPFLAQYITSLVCEDFNICVKTLSNWVDELNHKIPIYENWTQLHEPLDEDLYSAFAAILAKKTCIYDAIIIDEGQDFKESWWSLIEAALDMSNEKIIYIFYDDNQILNYSSAKYPIKKSPHCLSKNVRNAGNIYELLSQFHSHAPETSAFLEGFGVTNFKIFDNNNIKKSIDESVNELTKHFKPSQIAILGLSDDIIDDLISKHHTFDITIDQTLLDTIKNHLKQISIYFKVSISQALIDSLTLNPTSYTKKALKQFTNKCTRSSSIDMFQLKRDKLTVSNFEWKEKNLGGINKSYELHITSTIKRNNRKNNLTALELLNYYDDEMWYTKLPAIPNVNVEPVKNFVEIKKDIIPFTSISNFKGLESKAIILIINMPISDIETFLYVGISRAVYQLEILIDQNTFQYIKNTGRRLNKNFS